MKIRYFYRSFLPLLVAFFNVLGSTAYSFNDQLPDPDARTNEYLQPDQNSSALYLEEVSAGVPFQITSKNDLTPGRDLISGKGLFNHIFPEDNKLTSILLRDKKEILKTSIFPFHFFW